MALFSSLGNGKKRRSQTRAGQRMQEMRDVAQQANRMPDEVNARPAVQSANRHRRADARPTQTREAECGYCMGEIAVEATLPHQAVAAVKEADRPCVNVGALQKEWGLSDLQNVVLWQEILNKPLAARRRGLK